MPPTTNHFGGSRRPCLKDDLVAHVESQLILVAGLIDNVARDCSPHARVTSVDPGSEQRPACHGIVLPTTTAPSALQRQPVSRLTRRDDPSADPNIEPAVLDPDIVWASVIPNPPPPYMPTMALRATTLAPVVDSVTSGPPQYMPIPKIATIIACVLLGLILGGAIAKEAGRRKLIRKKCAAKAPFRFRVPKFPNVRGRLAKGIECLSWNMENGVEMATRAEFDDRTWGTPMHAKGTPGTSEVETPIITRENANSPDTRSYAVPWSVSSYRYRSSCPPALGTFIANLEEETDPIAARAVSMSMDHSISRIGTPVLETISEESIDFFVGQEAGTAQVVGLDLQYPTDGCSFTPHAQPGSGPVSVNLTSAESMSTILALTSAGVRSAGKRENATRGRPRQGSDASRSTEASARTDMDSSSECESGASSNTSIATMIPDTDADEEEGDEESDGSKSEGDEVFELKRVTDSMEVKKGILLALTKGHDGESPPEVPKLEVSRLISSGTDSTTSPNSDLYVSEEVTDEGYADDNRLHPALIAKSSTCSLMTLESSASGASIDLDDFPSPPGSFLIPSITFTLSTDSGPITLVYQ